MEKLLKFDSATVTLNDNAKTDKIILNVDLQLQDVPFRVTRVGQSDVNGSNSYNPVLGGWDNNANFVQEPTTWPHQSTQGFIPEPSFQPLGSRFIIQDPTNPNPSNVDQSGLVPGTMNYMEVGVEPVYIQFTTTNSDGTQGIFNQTQTLLIGYVARFVDTKTGQIHTIFVDSKMALNIGEAISILKLKILNTSNWDVPQSVPALVEYLTNNPLAIQNFGDDKNNTSFSQIKFLEDVNLNNNKLQIEFDQNGNFLRVIGLTSGDLTHIEAHEVIKANGDKQIFIAVDQNSQLSFHTNASSPEQDVSGQLIWSNFSSPELNNLKQRLLQAGFDINVLYGIEMIKEEKDQNVILRQGNGGVAPAPNPNFNLYYPKLIGPNGAEIRLSPSEFNEYLKALLATTHGVKPGSTLYTFIEALDFTFDSSTGNVAYTDPTNGALGWKIDDAQSRFNFFNNTRGFEIFIIEQQVPKYSPPVDLTFHHGNLSERENIGHLIFDQLTNIWSQNNLTLNTGQIITGLDLSQILQKHNSTLVFEQNLQGNRFILTTDGTFTPIDVNDIKWIQDKQNPNIWYGMGNQPQFTGQPPIVLLPLHLEFKDVVEEVGVNVEVVDSLTNTLYNTSQVVYFEHDLFTNTFIPSPNQSQKLIDLVVNNHPVFTNLQFRPDVVKLDDYQNKQNLVNLVDKNTLGVNPQFKFSNLRADYSNPTKPLLTIILTTSLTSGVHNPGQFHPITVNLYDNNGNIIDRAIIVQDPITGNILLEDEQGQPLNLSHKLQVQVDGILNNLVATGFDMTLKGNSAHEHDFVNVTFVDINGNRVTRTLSGDSFKSTI